MRSRVNARPIIEATVGLSLHRWVNGFNLRPMTSLTRSGMRRAYVCQQQQDPPVMVFDREGNYVDPWGTGLIREPHTKFIGPDDVLCVADRGDHVALKMTLGLV